MAVELSNKLTRWDTQTAIRHAHWLHTHICRHSYTHILKLTRTRTPYLPRETALRNKRETLPSEPPPSDDVAAVRFQLPQGVKLARRFHRDHTVQVGRSGEQKFLFLVFVFVTVLFYFFCFFLGGSGSADCTLFSDAVCVVLSSQSCCRPVERADDREGHSELSIFSSPLIRQYPPTFPTSYLFSSSPSFSSYLFVFSFSFSLCSLFSSFPRTTALHNHRWYTTSSRSTSTTKASTSRISWSALPSPKRTSPTWTPLFWIWWELEPFFSHLFVLFTVWWLIFVCLTCVYNIWQYYFIFIFIVHRFWTNFSISHNHPLGPTSEGHALRPGPGQLEGNLTAKNG